jgi:hypothetical protein
VEAKLHALKISKSDVIQWSDSSVYRQKLSSVSHRADEEIKHLDAFWEGILTARCKQNCQWTKYGLNLKNSKQELIVLLVGISRAEECEHVTTAFIGIPCQNNSCMYTYSSGKLQRPLRFLGGKFQATAIAMLTSCLTYLKYITPASV